MGVMDNKLHTESARVATLSNGSHSEGRSGKMPMENGGRACGAGLPAYKQRRVSAVRDFPPGCGRFATLIGLRPKEPAACADMANGDKGGNLLESNCIMQSEDRVDSQSPIMQSSAPKGMLGLIGHVGCSTDIPFILSNQVDEVKLISTKPAGSPSCKINFVESLEGDTFDTAKNLHQVDVSAPIKELLPSSDNSSGNVLRKAVATNYPPRRKVSAIRDFPPFCGRNAQRLDKEVPKNESLRQEKVIVQEELPKVTVKIDVKTAANIHDGNAPMKMLKENGLRLIGDEVQVKAEGNATNEKRKQENFRTSKKGMMGVEEVTSEKCVEPSDEGNTSESHLKSEAVFQNGNREFGKAKDNLVKDVVVYRGNESPQMLLSNSCSCEDHLQKGDFKGSESETVIQRVNKDVRDLKENMGKAIVVYTEDQPLMELPNLSSPKYQLQEENPGGSELEFNRIIVQGLLSSQTCPSRRGKATRKPSASAGAGKSKGKKHDFVLLQRSESRTKKEAGRFGGTSSKRGPSPKGKDYQGMGMLVIRNNEESIELEKDHMNFELVPRSNSFNVSLPPSRPSGSRGKGDVNDATASRTKVRETLRLFHAVCRKLLQEEEAKLKERGSSRKRVDLAAYNILKVGGKFVNTGKQIIGTVPGVEVGDEFHYRVELNIIGLHRQTQAGIDFVKQGQKALATSIVASEGYDDELDNSDVLIYTGQGGNATSGDKQPEDQKLERGNLALSNSIHEKNPVRVIRGERKDAKDSSEARVKKYVYDGLYLVEECRKSVGAHGKLVFKFQLRRIPGQPELAWKVVKKSKKFKIREGLCVPDISQGKELIPICAVNTLDDEKPPPFNYTTNMIYPDWCHPISPRGCGCIKPCSESGQCSCVAKNGGEIPYNYNGAIVEAKPLVYECGLSCKCPPSCYNRVSQYGIRFQLEIFKTESRGWGVRSLNSIPSGSFICEYAGELLEEKEAEQRAGNDEYLFDIGNNYNDNSLWDGLSTLMPDAHMTSCEVVEGGGFTIDAANYGNVGRFINHSCSPNLYAQNVLYDHEDKRIPHIMFFAAENIPPLQELTYHYNYMIDQVHDSDGNIKKKKCYCGSSECSGRLY